VGLARYGERQVHPLEIARHAFRIEEAALTGSSDPGASARHELRLHRQRVRELTVGQPFGAITAVSHRKVRETVRAKTSLELFALSGDDLAQAMAAEKGFEEQIKVLLMAHQ